MVSTVSNGNVGDVWCFAKDLDPNFNHNLPDANQHSGILVAQRGLFDEIRDYCARNVEFCDQDVNSNLEESLAFGGNNQMILPYASNDLPEDNYVIMVFGPDLNKQIECLMLAATQFDDLKETELTRLCVKVLAELILVYGGMETVH